MNEVLEKLARRAGWNEATVEGIALQWIEQQASLLTQFREHLEWWVEQELEAQRDHHTYDLYAEGEAKP